MCTAGTAHTSTPQDTQDNAVHITLCSCTFSLLSLTLHHSLSCACPSLSCYPRRAFSLSFSLAPHGFRLPAAASRSAAHSCASRVRANALFISRASGSRSATTVVALPRRCTPHHSLHSARTSAFSSADLCGAPRMHISSGLLNSTHGFTVPFCLRIAYAVEKGSSKSGEKKRFIIYMQPYHAADFFMLWFWTGSQRLSCTSLAFCLTCALRFLLATGPHASPHRRALYITTPQRTMRTRLQSPPLAAFCRFAHHCDLVSLSSPASAKPSQDHHGFAPAHHICICCSGSLSRRASFAPHLLRTTLYGTLSRTLFLLHIPPARTAPLTLFRQSPSIPVLAQTAAPPALFHYTLPHLLPHCCAPALCAGSVVSRGYAVLTIDLSFACLSPAAPSAPLFSLSLLTSGLLRLLRLTMHTALLAPGRLRAFFPHFHTHHRRFWMRMVCLCADLMDCWFSSARTLRAAHLPAPHLPHVQRRSLLPGR